MPAAEEVARVHNMLFPEHGNIVCESVSIDIDGMSYAIHPTYGIAGMPTELPCCC